MKKKEFLSILRNQLQGSLSETEIEGHLHYYNEYISESVAAGKSEAQVLEELGSPVMIARSLIDTAGTSRQGSGHDAGDSFKETQQDGQKKETGVPKWLIMVLIVLILFMMLTMLGRVIAFAARFFVPIMVVVLVIALVKSRRGE